MKQQVRRWPVHHSSVPRERVLAQVAATRVSRDQQQAPPVASQQPSQQPSLFGISLTSLLVLSSSRGARRAP
jgi:hypothetical protein